MTKSPDFFPWHNSFILEAACPKPVSDTDTGAGSQ